jgi:hypothetical protein
MSAANAAAIRRRANIQPISQTTSSPANTSSNTSTSQKTAGLTLPQVIQNLDSRIKTLESVSKNTLPNSSSLPSDFVNEMNSRFEILATEIGELKNTIMKLQTFTMEVNKSLYDDRINILSDVGNQSTNSYMYDNLSVEDIKDDHIFNINTNTDESDTNDNDITTNEDAL